MKRGWRVMFLNDLFMRIGTATSTEFGSIYNLTKEQRRREGMEGRKRSLGRERDIKKGREEGGGGDGEERKKGGQKRGGGGG